MAAGLLAATACSGGARHDAGPVRGGRVLLTHGIRSGIRWGLWAWEQTEGGRRTLCLALSGPRGYSATGAPGVPPTGGCAFNDRFADSGYYTSGPGPGSSISVSFGPLPTRAVAVRVGGVILPTRPFPAGRGLPEGRYWIRFAGSRVTGTAVPGSMPVPLDADHHPVPFQAF